MLRPVRRPIAALLAVSGVFAGCGDGPSDTERVHDAVEAFGEASAAKDYQRLCDDLLAPKLVSDVESAGLPCEAALKQGLGSVSAPKLTIGEITVTVDAESVETCSGPEAADALANAAFGDHGTREFFTHVRFHKHEEEQIVVHLLVELYARSGEEATGVLEEAARGELTITSLAEESRPPASTGGGDHPH